MIHICAWRALDRYVETVAATHVVSLLGIEGRPQRPASIDPVRHLDLEMDDIAAHIAGYAAPNEAQVAQLLDFGRTWNMTGPMVVHCYAGVSRSTAAALAVMCLYNEGREYEVARLLRERAPHAQPNRRIVQLTDRALGLDGRLIDAVAAIGAATPYDGRARTVELPARLN